MKKKMMSMTCWNDHSYEQIVVYSSIYMHMLKIINLIFHHYLQYIDGSLYMRKKLKWPQILNDNHQPICSSSIAASALPTASATNSFGTSLWRWFVYSHIQLISYSYFFSRDYSWDWIKLNQFIYYIFAMLNSASRHVSLLKSVFSNSAFAVCLPFPAVQQL